MPRPISIASARLLRCTPIRRFFRPITLISQQTELGRQFEGAGNYLTETLGEFSAVAEQEKSGLPGALDTDLAKIREMADQAVKDQTPPWFSRGIPDQVGFAEEKLALLEVPDGPAAAATRKQFDETRGYVKQQEASRREGNMASNPLPPDRYPGGDKAALAEAAVAAWTKVQSQAEVLGARIPSEEWRRETLWRYSNAWWYKIDRSRLRAQVLVKLDDKTAAVRSVNLWKGHLSGNALTATPLDDRADAPDPRFIVLLEKLK